MEISLSGIIAPPDPTSSSLHWVEWVTGGGISALIGMAQKDGRVSEKLRLKSAWIWLLPEEWSEQGTHGGWRPLITLNWMCRQVEVALFQAALTKPCNLCVSVSFVQDFLGIVQAVEKEDFGTSQSFPIIST